MTKKLLSTSRGSSRNTEGLSHSMRGLSRNTGGLSRNMRGSALVIAILVITAISTVGFSVGKLMVAELQQSGQIEDAMMAYNAAEAGIEQGLLMWRYNHDVQVPKPSPGGEDMSSDVHKAFRVYMDDMDPDVPSNLGKPAKAGNTGPYYDLRIWYKNDGNKELVCSDDALSPDCKDARKGNQEYVNTGTKPALAKDQAVEYDIEGVEKLKLKWEFEDNTKCRGIKGRNCKLEFIPISENGELLTDYKKVYNYNDRKGVSAPRAGLFPDEIKVARMRIFGEGLKEYSVKIDRPSDAKTKMSSRYTIIESTGYFGSVKRKLQIRVNRYSGAILGPYDFIIYQGGTD